MAGAGSPPPQAGDRAQLGDMAIGRRSVLQQADLGNLMERPEDAFDNAHRDHAEMSKAKSSVCCTSPAGVVENDIKNIWGRSGSWHVSSKLPRGGKEEKHSIRGIEVLPTGVSKTVLEEWGVGYVNAKGMKGFTDRTVGQDNFSVSRLQDGWEVFCVMDGHGTDGHWPSARGVKTMPFFLQSDECSALLAKGDIENALVCSFRDTERDLVRRGDVEGVDVSGCGATATCVLRNPNAHPGKLWVAWVGDSRAVLYVPGQGIVMETTDHKPNLPLEEERLCRMGSEVRSQSHANGFVETRIFVKGKDYPGLCMSRSLGDEIVKDRGVTWLPEVEEWSTKDYPGAFFLGASDGLWEFCENEDVGKLLEGYLADSKSHQDIVRELHRESVKRWQDNEGPSYCDDITVFLFKADCEAAPCFDGVVETAHDNNVEMPCGMPGCTVS